MVRPFCLAIGGFDPSGGAGVLADCKTMEQLRVNTLSVITANTFQTDNRFDGLEWVPQDQVSRQLDLILSGYKIEAVKIGLIENVESIRSLVSAIRVTHPKTFIIWDPVLRASADLSNNLSDSRFDSVTALLPHLDLITPNTIEARILFGEGDLQDKAEEYNCSILLKGGHAEKRGYDTLYTPGDPRSFAPKIHGAFEKHGSGCVYASAITAHVARCFPLAKAIFRSKRYVERFLTSADGLTGYHSR